MKRLILITFSDPKNTWYNSSYTEFIKYFLKKIKKRFGIKEDFSLTIKYLILSDQKEVGKILRDRNPEVAGVVVEAHSSIEVNRRNLFLSEIMGDKNHPIEIFFFKNKKTFLLRSIFREELEGEEL